MPKATKAKQPHGRPTAYTAELGQRICELLGEGKTLTSICRKNPELPSDRTIRTWALEPDHPFSPQYVRAREVGYLQMADETIDLGDDVAPEPGAVAKARLRTDTRKWLLSKCLPKIFGDRITTEVTGHALVVEKEVSLLELARWIAFTLTTAAPIPKRHAPSKSSPVPTSIPIDSGVLCQPHLRPATLFDLPTGQVLHFSLGEFPGLAHAVAGEVHHEAVHAFRLAVGGARIDGSDWSRFVSAEIVGQALAPRRPRPRNG